MNVVPQTRIKDHSPKNITKRYRNLIPHPPLPYRDIRARKHSYWKHEHVYNRMLKAQGKECSDGQPHQHYLSRNASGSLRKNRAKTY